MNATAERCSCGQPMQAVATKSGHPLTGCHHCDRACTRKNCRECRRAGVKH